MSTKAGTPLQFCTRDEYYCDEGKFLFEEMGRAYYCRVEKENEWGVENAHQETERDHKATLAYEAHLPYCQIPKKQSVNDPMSPQERDLLLYHIKKSICDLPYYEEDYIPDAKDILKHQIHLQQNVYYTPCFICRRDECDDVAYAYNQKVEYIYIEEDGIPIKVMGLIENARTQNDTVWVIYELSKFILRLFYLYNPSLKNKISLQKVIETIVRANYLTRDATLVTEEEFRRIVNSLPRGRKSV